MKYIQKELINCLKDDRSFYIKSYESPKIITSWHNEFKSKWYYVVDCKFSQYIIEADYECVTVVELDLPDCRLRFLRKD